MIVEVGMTRLRLLTTAVLAVVALVAGACGAPDDGTLRALPRAGGAAPGSASAAMLAEDAGGGGGGGWAPYQPTTYVLGDGVTAPTSAPAYQLGGGEPSKEQVERLATAMGLEGKVRAEDRAFVVEDGDVVLEVRRSALGAWTVTNEAAHAVVESCAHAVDLVVPEGGEGPDTAVSSGVAVTDQHDGCPAPPPVEGLLNSEEARRRVQQIVEVGGSSAFDYEVSDGDSSDRATSVSVEVSHRGHVLHELSTWWEFGEDGEILNGMGFLASPQSLGDYPLVSAADAVHRLNDRDRGVHPLVDRPAPRPGDDAAGSGATSSPGATEPAIAPSEPAPCPPEADCVAEPAPVPTPAPEELEPVEVAIVAIDLSYALVPTGYCEDDTVLLVPQLELEADGGDALWVEALTDEHLQQPSDGDVEAEPCPEDAEGQEPGREPGSAPGGAGEPEPVPMPAEVEPDR